ncbi:MAG: hypothetical protein BWZ10_01519 [candidate division BRC1 bacterium ADurb.BinA364]|nr:MAG: hypothetical protein BWZ10_01519 [candidate division BRC1 bacterium ADurb.BinA364]
MRGARRILDRRFLDARGAIVPVIQSRAFPFAEIAPDNAVQNRGIVRRTCSLIQARSAIGGLVFGESAIINNRAGAAVVAHRSGARRAVAAEKAIDQRRRAAKIVVHAAALLRRLIAFEDAPREQRRGVQIVGDSSPAPLGEVVLETAIDKNRSLRRLAGTRRKSIAGHIVDRSALGRLVVFEDAMADRRRALEIEHAAPCSRPAALHHAIGRGMDAAAGWPHRAAAYRCAGARSAAPARRSGPEAVAARNAESVQHGPVGAANDMIGVVAVVAPAADVARKNRWIVLPIALIEPAFSAGESAVERHPWLERERRFAVRRIAGIIDAGGDPDFVAVFSGVQRIGQADEGALPCGAIARTGGLRIDEQRLAVGRRRRQQRQRQSGQGRGGASGAAAFRLFDHLRASLFDSIKPSRRSRSKASTSRGDRPFNAS